MTDRTKKCPQCAEEIKEEAKVCRYCKAEFKLIEKGYCKSCKEVVELDEAGKCKKCGGKALDKHTESVLLEKLEEKAVKALETKPSGTEKSEEKTYYLDVGRLVRRVWIPTAAVAVMFLGGLLGALVLFIVPAQEKAIATTVIGVVFGIMIVFIALGLLGRAATHPREAILSPDGLVFKKKDGSVWKSLEKILLVGKNKIIGVTSEGKKVRMMMGGVSGSMSKEDWKDFLANARSFFPPPEIPTGVKIVTAWMYILGFLNVLGALTILGAYYYTYYRSLSSGMLWIGPIGQVTLMALIGFIIGSLHLRIACDLRDLMPTGRLLTIALSILGILPIATAIIYGPILWYMFRPEIKELYT